MADDIYYPGGEDPLIVAYSDIDTNNIVGSWTGEGNINSDPDFQEGDSLRHLNGGSPCQDSGIESLEVNGIVYSCPDHDYEGDPRPAPWGGPDMGADEHFYVGGEALQVTGYRLQVFPNPSSGAAHLRLVISDHGIVILDLYEISGKRIQRLLNEVKKTGTYEMEVDVSDMPTGIYILRLMVGDIIETKKLILINDY
jgi:hypothetical protein